MKYELVREIFNSCSNNQMRDVYVDEIETDDPKAYLSDLLEGKDIEIQESTLKDGTLIFDVYIANLHQRFGFTEI